jgi:predicted DNA-binding transcriptional regulator YafY
MTRTDRLDLLLRMLRDRPGITAAELAQELDTSTRCIFRDVAYLRDRGYLIESSRGRGGGMRLHPNWGLSKVLLSAEEALGVLISLAVAERLAPPMFAAGLGRARKKLVDVFPYHERRRLSPLRERVMVGRSASPRVSGSYGVPDANAMRVLQSAFLNERVMSCVYVREDGERSERRMEPHGIMLNWPAWYIVAMDYLRGEPRTFRLDRFVSVREEAETFRARPQAMLSAMGGPERVESGLWHL